MFFFLRNRKYNTIAKPNTPPRYKIPGYRMICKKTKGLKKLKYKFSSAKKIRPNKKKPILDNKNESKTFSGEILFLINVKSFFEKMYNVNKEPNKKNGNTNKYIIIERQSVYEWRVAQDHK